MMVKGYTRISSTGLERLGQPEAYVRSKGISAARHQAMIEIFARAHGKVVRQNVVELCDLSSDQATRLLAKMLQDGKLLRHGRPPRWVYYTAAQQS